VIVTCQTCNTAFRVPDGKIGPRGARVRCSRCKAVFAVAPGEQAAPPPSQVPGLDLDLTGSVPAAPRDDPFARFATPRPRLAPGTPPPLPPPAPPAAPPIPALLEDPFAQPPAGATPALSDPFAALENPQPPGMAGRGPEADPFASLPPLPDPVAGAGTPLPGGAAISLEEVQNRRPVSHAPPGLEAIDAVEARADFRTPGPSGLEVQERARQALAAEAPAVAAPPRPARTPSAPLPPAPGPATAGPAAPVPAARRFGLSSLMVNSLSLALLLALAGGLYLSWKGLGKGTALWPPGGGARPEPLLAARDVRAGLFDTAAGRPVLCVRGQVEARAATAGPVRVLVEVTTGGRKVARAEALAGAVPTPEEVWLLDGAAGAERLRSSLAPRAAPRMGPGERQPFTAVLWDFPEDLRGLDVRVVAEPAG